MLLTRYRWVFAKLQQVSLGRIRKDFIILVIYSKAIQWHSFNLSSYNWMNFRVYQIGVSRPFSKLGRAFAKCRDAQTLMLIPRLAWISDMTPGRLALNGKILEISPHQNTGNFHVRSYWSTFLPCNSCVRRWFWLIIFGSRTLNVVKSTNSIAGIPVWAYKLILQSLFVIFIKPTLNFSIMYQG